MKKAELVAILLALLGASPLLAQEAGDAYDEYFGWEDEGMAGGNDEGKVDPPTGPRSVKEAREQGRGYRIGSGGITPQGGRDIHVVQDGDTLWDISNKYYGDPWSWPELWSFNPEITNPHWIYPADQVRLSTSAVPSDQLAGASPAGGYAAGAPGATAGMLSGTEAAPNVVVPISQRKPGSVFLQNEGFLDQEALRTVGQVIGGNEEQMMLSTTDQVYVRFKQDHDVRAGQQYAIFRDIYDWERDPDEKGKLVRIHGTVVIRSYDRQKRVARGVITETIDPIERGYYVANIERRFDLVEPVRNTGNVVARVIASVRPRALLSYDNVVFLDVGEGKGIKPGNRFFIVRRGDDWMRNISSDPQDLGNLTPIPEYDETSLPKEVIAELRVIKVRKNTTIALVTRSDTDIFLGDTAELRPGF
jgi:hypothetical protein